MARASEQFRQSDAALWGVVALVSCAIAVMGANVSALIPSSVLGGLHRTRIEGASLEQLRLQVADLRQQSVELKRENAQLLTRFALEEQQNNEVVQRVGALEVSLPRIMEAMPEGGGIDRSTITSSIGEEPPLVFDADGGSVAIRQRPMQEAQPGPAEQPLPDQIAALPSTNDFAVALGAPVAPEQAEAAWRDLSMKLGPLLFGLSPHVVDDGAGRQQIVLGPLPQRAEAAALCMQVERVSISCMPTQLVGTPLQTPAPAQ
ncbi:SPOR domain-containing protein [Devosia submarina]|uniref:SPOR domain-containing protein n=1 Tax=Devosia submarina TaxID=1173082 RepID=UPI000D36A21A|nr:SPOR domain-containing protein [Devosia submarina]